MVALRFCAQACSFEPIAVGPDNGFVAIGVPASLAGVLAATGVLMGLTPLWMDKLQTMLSAGLRFDARSGRLRRLG